MENENQIEETKQDLEQVTEEAQAEEAQDQAEEAQAETEQEKQDRGNECVTTVNAAMDKFRCRFEVSMIVTTQGNIPRVVILPV